MTKASKVHFSPTKQQTKRAATATAEEPLMNPMHKTSSAQLTSQGGEAARLGIEEGLRLIKARTDEVTRMIQAERAFAGLEPVSELDLLIAQERAVTCFLAMRGIP